MRSCPHEKEFFADLFHVTKTVERDRELGVIFSQTSWYHFETPYSSYAARLLLMEPTICRSNFQAAQHQTACCSQADATSTYTCGMAQLLPHSLATLCHFVPHGIVWTYLYIHSVNFSKSNTFGENFIRTKFIFRQIFFPLSILLSRKTSLMFFSLFWKNCEKPFAGGHDHFEGKGLSGNKNQYKLFCKAVYTLIAKYVQKIVKNKKCIAEYFASLFSCFAAVFLLFVFPSIWHQGRHLRKKSKDLVVYFFQH